MSLDVSIVTTTKEETFSANITHSLNQMATAAGIYWHLWRPDEINVVFAGELIGPLKRGILKMKANPEKFKSFDAANGWGTYENFLPWCEAYLSACKNNPKGRVFTSK